MRERQAGAAKKERKQLAAQDACLPAIHSTVLQLHARVSRGSKKPAVCTRKATTNLQQQGEGRATTCHQHLVAWPHHVGPAEQPHLRWDPLLCHLPRHSDGAEQRSHHPPTLRESSWEQPRARQTARGSAKSAERSRESLLGHPRGRTCWGPPLLPTCLLGPCSYPAARLLTAHSHKQPKA